MRRIIPVILVLALAQPAHATPPPGTSCPVFPANNVWHADVSTLPVHARSASWITSMGGTSRLLHPDFGPSGTSVPYGIPYNVVAGTHAKVSVAFDYADESDPGPYPFGSDITIEGGSDRHAIMIDKDSCTLYELYAAQYSPGGSTAGSGAIFNLNSNALRPDTWTSADAAGLPIFAGLLRRDEVLAGNVDHAIRVTASRTDRSYLWPARHQAGYANDPTLPPMGARFRLKAGFDISGFRTDTQTVLRAFKKYGMIVADNGSNWYFQGTAENGWDTSFLDELKSIPAGAFEAVDESSLMVDPNSGIVNAVGYTKVVAPSVASNVSTSASFPVSWANPTPTVVYDVDWLEHMKDSAGRWTAAVHRWFTGTTAKSATFNGVPGHTYFFRARARTSTVTGPASPWMQTAVPVDDRSGSIAYTRGWMRYTNSHPYFGTLTVSRTAGAYATVSGDASGFAVVGMRCPSCGSFAVYVDGKYIKTVSESATATAYKAVLFTTSFPAIGRHWIRLVIAPGGRTAYLDGVAPIH